MAVSDYTALIEKHAAAFNVPAAWIKAIMLAESSGNPNAYKAEPRKKDASYGLMQLLMATARGLGYTGTPEGLYDPDTNIFLGTKLLAQLRSQWGDDFRRILSAYNSGKPDAYLSNMAVGAYVDRVIGYLSKFLNDEPLVATAGAGGALLIAVLLWLWIKRVK